MATTLKSVGFDVILIENAGKTALEAAIAEFGNGARRVITERAADMAHILHEHARDLDSVERIERIEGGQKIVRIVDRDRALVVDVRARATDRGFVEVHRDELEAHDPALLEKPIVVAFNKLDLPGAVEAWDRLGRDHGRKTLAESGLTLITGDSMADAAQKVVKAVAK